VGAVAAVLSDHQTPPEGVKRPDGACVTESETVGQGGGYLPRPKSAAGWFAAAVTKAKVQKITPHDLRHTCASLAVSACAEAFTTRS
jgi:integrase